VTLTCLIAHRAIERVIDEQKLGHARARLHYRWDRFCWPPPCRP
jgi:hypothetical protein